MPQAPFNSANGLGLVPRPLGLLIALCQALGHATGVAAPASVFHHGAVGHDDLDGVVGFETPSSCDFDMVDGHVAFAIAIYSAHRCIPCVMERCNRVIIPYLGILLFSYEFTIFKASTLLIFKSCLKDR